MINDVSVIDVGLGGISVLPDRQIPLNDALVKKITTSMGEIGQINPITLRSRGADCGYILIAGRHRLEAATALKWPSIKAIVLDGIDALDAEEIELRENFDRGETTPAIQAITFARLKAIKDEKNRLKRGAPKGNKNAAKKKNNSPQLGGNCSSEKSSNSTKLLAKETGRSESAIDRDSYRAKAIPQITDVIGTSLDKGAELDALAKLTPKDQSKLIARAKKGEKVSAKSDLKKTLRAKKEQDLAAKQMALPSKKYGVIYADPEWRFVTHSENGMDRSADNHYPTSTTEEIMARDVPSIAADDCVLFLWATVPMLPDALRVLSAWGFDYKSHFAWIKNQFGTGYWNRNKHELLLVGTKGAPPAPAPGTQLSSVISADARKHSQKPDEAYELIESYFPSLPKIELNARAARNGWDAWGLEAPQAEAAE